MPITTELHYSSDVTVVGRLGKFGLGVMRKKAESLGHEFATAFKQKIEHVAVEQVGPMDLFLPQTIEEAVGFAGPARGRALHLGWGNPRGDDERGAGGAERPDQLAANSRAFRYLARARRLGTDRRDDPSRRYRDIRGFKDGQCVVPHAAARIANRVVRNMGTMGGSISFADPAADYLAALTAAKP